MPLKSVKDEFSSPISKFPNNISDVYQSLMQEEKKRVNHQDDLFSLAEISDFQSLYDLLYFIAEKYPNMKAGWFWGLEISYNDLKILIDNCASNFTILGIQTGSVAAIQLPNSLELIISLFACHKLEVPVVFVNPTYKSIEINHVLKRTKALTYIGLNSYISRELANLEKLENIQHVIAVNLGDFKSEWVETKYIQKVTRFFHISLQSENCEGTYSFKQILHTPSHQYHPQPTMMKSQIITQRNSNQKKNNPHIQNTAIIIESYKKNGNEILSTFTHESILTQILQLRHVFQSIGSKYSDTDFNQAQIGFIAILPMSSPFGFIANIYLPIILKSYPVIFAEAPLTDNIIKNIKNIPSVNGNVLFATEIILTRISNYLENKSNRKSVLSNVSLAITCQNPSSQEFQQHFEDLTGIPVLNSYGKLDMPFISVQDPHSEKVDHPNNIGGILLPFTNIQQLDGNKVKIRGPQRSNYQFTQLSATTSLKSQKDGLNSSFLYPEDVCQLVHNNFLNISLKNTLILHNRGFNVLPNHLEHLYKYFFGIESVHVSQIPSLAKYSQKKMTPSDIQGFANSFDENSPLKLIFASLTVLATDFFSESEFKKWCHLHISQYRCPDQIEIHSLDTTKEKIDFEKNPEILTQKVQELVAVDTITQFHYYEDVKIEVYSEEELYLVNYQTLLRHANLLESTNHIQSREELLRCLAMIKKDPVAFVRKFPNRTNERKVLERRLNYIEGEYLPEDPHKLNRPLEKIPKKDSKKSMRLSSKFDIIEKK